MKDLELFKFIDEAIKYAGSAAILNEVPISCVVVKDNNIVLKTHNTCKTNSNRTEHAEINAINILASQGIEVLDEYTFIVTVEPCLMCYAACALAHVKQVIYVVNDEKFGYSNFINFSKSLQNLNILKTNYRENDIKEMLSEFFKKRRI